MWSERVDALAYGQSVTILKFTPLLSVMQVRGQLLRNGGNMFWELFKLHERLP